MPRGYKKVRHTFSRDVGTHTERIQFQGSAFNHSSRPWRFYINFGVEFHDLPAIERRDFPGTHWVTRIETIVLDLPNHFDLFEQGADDFADKIATYLEIGSRNVKQHIQQIRSAHDSKRWPQFPAA